MREGWPLFFFWLSQRDFIACASVWLRRMCMSSMCLQFLLFWKCGHMQAESPTSLKSIVMTHVCSRCALNSSNVCHLMAALFFWTSSFVRGGNFEMPPKKVVLVSLITLLFSVPSVRRGPLLQWYGAHSSEMLTVNRTGTSFYQPDFCHLRDRA